MKCKASRHIIIKHASRAPHPDRSYSPVAWNVQPSKVDVYLQGKLSPGQCKSASDFMDIFAGEPAVLGAWHLRASMAPLSRSPTPQVSASKPHVAQTPCKKLLTSNWKDAAPRCWWRCSTSWGAAAGRGRPVCRRASLCFRACIAARGPCWGCRMRTPTGLACFIPFIELFIHLSGDALYRDQMQAN